MKKIFSVLTFVLLISVLLTSCGMNVPRPEIKEGEFNFSVTYEYGGEIKNVSGIYVCEYAGLSWTLDGGYSRDWSGYIKGGTSDDHIIIDTEENGNEIILVLDFYPNYFMGDSDEVSEPYIMIKDYSGEGMNVIYDVKSIEEICGAKIISWEYDEPIKNSFGRFK